MYCLTEHFSIHLIKGASLKSNVRDWEMKSKSEAIREKAGGKQIRKSSNELSLRNSLELDSEKAGSLLGQQLPVCPPRGPLNASGFSLARSSGHRSKGK